MNSSIVYDYCIISLENKCRLKEVQNFEFFSQFKELFTEFFKFVESCSIKQFDSQYIKKSQNVKCEMCEEYQTICDLCKMYDSCDSYDLMFHNFNKFLDMALDCIHFYDIRTLCDGLSAQIKKFMEVYEHCNKVDKKYGALYTTFESVIGVCIVYSMLTPSHIFPSLYDRNMNEILDYDFDEKQMKSDLHSMRVQGHRQDYDQHIYNKGQNKKRRNHTFRLKERKNKKQRDYSV
jgi:hypothetical protein